MDIVIPKMYSIFVEHHFGKLCESYMIKLLLNTLYTTICLFILTLWSCSDKDEDLMSLQNEFETSIYLDNSELTARRIASIAYSTDEMGENREERFKLIHISDPHLSHWSVDNNHQNPVNLRQAIHFANREEHRFNAIVATGDFISNAKKSDAFNFLKAFANHFYQDNQVPSFACTGNHDSNMTESSPTQLITYSEIYTVLFSPENHRRHSEQSSNYYYADVDNPQGGTIRFIALDMLDQSQWKYDSLHYAYFSQEQIDWLANIALKEGVTPGHSIIILTHFPFQHTSWGGKGSFLSNGDYVHSWNMIPEIIEAYRSRTTIRKSYPNTLTPSQPIHVDFDFIAAQGEFVCYLGGHAHCFATFEVNQLENRDPSLPTQQMILCTNQAPTENSTFYREVSRKDKTTSSNSFNIYAIDTRKKEIHITFFGAYKPINDPSFPEFMILPY